MYRFDCEMCEKTLETSSLSEMKDRGRTHLNNYHRSEFRDVFGEEHRGKACLGGCGYGFPGETQNESGFECPTCGHDHFPQFAGRYLWWRLEVE